MIKMGEINDMELSPQVLELSWITFGGKKYRSMTLKFV